MRRLSTAVLAACAVGCLMVPAAWAGHHASSPQPSYPTYSYGYIPVGGPAGSPSEMAFEMTDDPPAAVEGEMAPGDVIGQHRLRVLDARVLDQPVQLSNRVIPAGTALARVTTELGKGPVIWCDLKPAEGFWNRGQSDCLADSRESGRFDQIWIGVSGTHFFGLTPSGAGTPRTLLTPAAYHHATLAERPVGLVGYRWCDGDGVATAPRFALSVMIPGEPKWWSSGKLGCQFGTWSGADHSKVDINGQTLTLSPGTKAGAFRYALSGRMSAAGQLATLVTGEPVRLASAPPPAPRVSATSSQDMALKALIETAPPTARAGVLGKGERFFSVAVRHGITGTLKNAVTGHTWLSTKTLAADQPVYGIPMSGTSGGHGLVWCAPQQEQGPDRQKHWVAACLPDNGQASVWVEAKPAMLATDLSWEGAGRTATPPVVERGPVSFPPMTLSYAFGGWNKQHWLTVDVQIDWGEGPKTLHSILIPPGADGWATFKAMGGDIAVREGPPLAHGVKPVEQAVVEVRSPPRSGQTIVY